MNQSNTLTSAEEARLNTFAVEIACAVRGTTSTEEPDGSRVGTHGSLKIWRTGTWYDFEAGTGGRGALDLIQRLRAVDRSDAIAYGREWLSRHMGEGGCDGGDGVAEGDAVGDEQARISEVKTLWGEGVPIAGTSAETYLRNRGLGPALMQDRVQKQLRYIADARGNEGMMLAAVTTEDGDVVAIQATYITPDGKKSATKPARLTHRGPRDWRERGLVRFDEGEGKTLVIAEGIEDALSLVVTGVGRAAAFGGVGGLGLAPPPGEVETLIIARDGDAPGSAADQAVHRGIVRSLAQRLEVRVTATPRDDDANSILQSKGVPGLRELIDAAEPDLGRFDDTAFREELYRLDDVRYGQARKDAARLLGVGLEFLDRDRTRVRLAWAEPGLEAESEVPLEQQPWPEPVTDIGEVLDAAVGEIGNYVVSSEDDLIKAALWAAFSHCVNQAALGVRVSPRLGIQSETKRAGKSTLLECVENLAARPMMSSSISPASVFRLVHQEKPTLLIDEADNLLSRKNLNPELLAIFNSGHRRKGAFVQRTERGPDDQFVTLNFSTFTAIAFAGIKSLPETLQDRSIVIRLRRAKPGEVRKHLTDGDSSVLLECRRKLARWAADLDHLPKIQLPPALFNRLGDNWRPLLQIAKFAGEEWFRRAVGVAIGAAEGDEDENMLVQLLDAIWNVFLEKGIVRIATKGLLDALLGEDEGRWKEARNGREITEYWLRDMLKGCIPTTEEMRKARKWRDGQVTHRGYVEAHFADAWARYLLRDPPSRAGKDAGRTAPGGKFPGTSSSATSATSPKTATKVAIYTVSDTDTSSATNKTASATEGATSAVGGEEVGGRGLKSPHPAPLSEVANAAAVADANRPAAHRPGSSDTATIQPDQCVIPEVAHVADRNAPGDFASGGHAGPQGAGRRAPRPGGAS